MSFHQMCTFAFVSLLTPPEPCTTFLLVQNSKGWTYLVCDGQQQESQTLTLMGGVDERVVK